MQLTSFPHLDLDVMSYTIPIHFGILKQERKTGPFFNSKFPSSCDFFGGEIFFINLVFLEDSMVMSDDLLTINDGFHCSTSVILA